MRSVLPVGHRLAMMLLASALLAGSATTPGIAAAVDRPDVPSFRPTGRDRSGFVPRRLTDASVDLRAGPVPVPLELELPSLGVSAPVAGVGLTPGNVMDAPMGPAGDPVWQQAFWYRGSAVPGARSTALMAGHIDGPGGAPAVFAHLDALRPGDPVVVRDTHVGLDVRFSVTRTSAYSLDQAAAPEVLAQIYGAGPVVGTPPQPSTDGRSHLTLVTCAGTFRNGTHDHRLVVYATRIT